MCGCMLMHAMMNHEEHQHSSQSTSIPQVNAMSAASGKKCSHCSFPLGEGFAFCPNCGVRLQEAKCSACGQRIDPSWKTCAYCGSPLGEAEKQSAIQ